MITEYNWNANPDADKAHGVAADPRAQKNTFLEQWTARAIGVLVQNRVFAANQYVLTNNASLALINDRTHQLTGAGRAFQSTYEQDHPATSHPTLTATGTTTAPPGHLLCAGASTGQGSAEHEAAPLALHADRRNGQHRSAWSHSRDPLRVAHGSHNTHATSAGQGIKRRDDGVFPGQGTDLHGTGCSGLSDAEGREEASLPSANCGKPLLSFLFSPRTNHNNNYAKKLSHEEPSEQKVKQETRQPLS